MPVILLLALAVWSRPSSAAIESTHRQAAIDQNQLQDFLDQTHKTNKAFSPIPPGCFAPSPHPTAPSGTAVSVSFYGEWTPRETWLGTLWREPCAADPKRSFLYLRVSGLYAPFICSSSFAVIQNGNQYNNVKLTQGSNSTSSFCDDLHVPTTFLVGSYSFGPFFDRNKSFQLLYEGVYADWSASLPEYVPPQQAIEYYHRSFNHYFVTADSTEIAALDGGKFAGWARTEQAFLVYPLSNTLAGVCRFFSTSFNPSSHFYTPFADECTTVKSNPRWQFEGTVFGVRLPDVNGNCTASRPLYRLYNNGQGGAPNHRYTTDSATRSTMIAQGWIPEGFGPLGIGACVP